MTSNMVIRLRHWVLRLFGGQVIADHVKSMEVPNAVEVSHQTHALPYDENLLERAHTQWLFGDWQDLAQLTRDTLQNHPDRAKLALLAAAGRFQTGLNAEAKAYIILAQDWGASKKLISQILIAGVHNSIGRAAAIGDLQHRVVHHFESALQVGSQSSDVRLLTQTRLRQQLEQLCFILTANEIILEQKENSDRACEIFLSSEDSKNRKHDEKSSSKDDINERDLALIFENIYRTKAWGVEDEWKYYSGSGSHDVNNINPFIAAMEIFFGGIGLAMSAIDIGCGDFNVGKHISKLFGDYIAIDVVSDLINYNIIKYVDSNVKFMCIDATEEPLPEADVAILRQVLQHLSNNDIAKLLKNIEGKYKYLVVVEHLPVGLDWDRNIDRPSGQGIRLEINSGIEIEAPPFEFVYKQMFTIADSHEFGGVIKSKVYVL